MRQRSLSGAVALMCAWAVCAAPAVSAAVTSGVYTLTNVHSDMLMDVRYESTEPGVPVLQWPFTGGANQQWVIAQSGSFYSLTSANSGLCLDTPDPANATPPVQLVQKTCDGSKHQQWDIRAVGDGTYNLLNVDNGLLADNAGESKEKGTAIIQWGATGGANQRWRLTKLTRVGTYSAGLRSHGQTVGRTFDQQTIRMVAHTSVAGSLPRLRLSNLYGTAPLTLGPVDLARQGGTPGAVVPGTHHTVTFGGSTSITIPAGQEVFSDPLHMTVAADQNLLVSIYLPKGADTWHELAMDTTWVAKTSDTDKHVADDTTAHYQERSSSTFVLAGVDVISATATGTIVAVGDSITDGYNSTSGANHRWPDYFARLLNQNAGGRSTRGVVNVGISANKILAERTLGNYALIDGFKEDVLRQTNAKEVILLEGINDISEFGGSTPADRAARAQDMKNGMLNVINQARAAGLKITGCTILPWRGFWSYNDFREAIRQDVNDWIRTGNAFDSVIDLDQAMRDANDPHALNPAYVSPTTRDPLHPGDAGYQHMAETIYNTIAFP